MGGSAHLLGGRVRSLAFVIAVFGVAWGRASGQGYIYVSNQQGTTIGKYTTSGQVVNSTLITGLSGPEAIVLDGKGDLYVANSFSSTIGEYTTSGQVVNASLITTDVHPEGIAIDEAGHLFVSGRDERLDPRIEEYTTSGDLINPYLITDPVLRNVKGIAADQHGHLFVANTGWRKISEFTTSGDVVNEDLITGLDFPFDLALDGQGNLFVSDGVVSKYTTSGSLLQHNVTPGFAEPSSIALDGDGYLYVGGPDGTLDSPIGKYTVSGDVVNASMFTYHSPLGLAVETPEPGSITLMAIAGMALLRRRS